MASSTIPTTKNSTRRTRVDFFSLTETSASIVAVVAATATAAAAVGTDFPALVVVCSPVLNPFDCDIVLGRSSSAGRKTFVRPASFAAVADVDSVFEWSPDYLSMTLWISPLCFLLEARPAERHVSPFAWELIQLAPVESYW